MREERRAATSADESVVIAGGRRCAGMPLRPEGLVAARGPASPEAAEANFESRNLHRYEQYTEEEVRAELRLILNLHTKACQVTRDQVTRPASRVGNL